METNDLRGWDALKTAENDAALKEKFIEFIETYLTPSFGSISKRDTDILLFEMLKSLGFFKNPKDVYEVLLKLKVTRSKARNLIYESELRNEEVDLELELQKILLSPVFLKEGKKISLEIDNPLLIDHLRYRLKEERYLSDGSFAPEVVKISTEAFSSLVKSFIKDEEGLQKILEEAGLSKKDKAKDAVEVIVKLIIGRFIGEEVSKAVGEHVSDYLGLLLDGSKANWKKLVTKLQKDKQKS